MKTWIGLLLLLGFVSLGAIGGCSSNNSDNFNTDAMTENDFATDPGLSARQLGGIIVDLLEAPGSPLPDFDTGGIGNDIIPYNYDRTVSNTFCWEDDDIGAMHTMTLVDEFGTEQVSLQANGPCQNAVLGSGNYEMRIQHDGMTQDSLPVFISSEETQLVQRTPSGIINRLLASLHIIEDAHAQMIDHNVSILLSSRKCQGCNLQDADLRSAFLNQANIEGADCEGASFNESTMISALLNGGNFRNADFSNVDMQSVQANMAFFTNANLGQAKLDQATFQNTQFKRVTAGSLGCFKTNFTNSDLTDSTFRNANCEGAIFKDANLTGVAFNSANLQEAELTGATLSGTDFSGAMWCSGTCTCAANSTDSCGGCADVSQCTGP